MSRSRVALVAAVLSFVSMPALLVGPALAADLDVVVPPPVVVEAAPVAVGVPVAIPVPVFVPLLPLFGPPSPPPPPVDLFSEPNSVPTPVYRYPPVRTAAQAEAEHYGYNRYVRSPRPIGFYGPRGSD